MEALMNQKIHPVDCIAVGGVSFCAVIGEVQTSSLGAFCRLGRWRHLLLASYTSGDVDTVVGSLMADFSCSLFDQYLYPSVIQRS